MNTPPRKMIERELETRHPNSSLMQYLTTARGDKKSLRVIADDLSQLTGVRVSHESIRKWLRDG